MKSDLPCGDGGFPQTEEPASGSTLVGGRVFVKVASLKAKQRGQAVALGRCDLPAKHSKLRGT